MNIRYEVLPPFPPVWAKEAGEDQFGIYADIEIKGIIQRMRWIHPGTFMMGSPESEEGRYNDEKQHKVTLTKGYWLSDTLCTQELWKKVMNGNPAKFKFPAHPVETVSWDDCNEFFDRINQIKFGLSLALPTEAQWEYACRAGTETAIYVNNLITDEKINGQLLDSIAWFKDNSENTTHPVKMKLPNSWGLYDLLGNVWEWCRDMYADYRNHTTKDPYNKDGSSPVLRSGSWFESAQDIRSAGRSDDSRARRDIGIGFRFSQG